VLVIVVAALGLVAPVTGTVLAPAVGWLLALLLFAVSLSFDLDAVLAVLRRPRATVVASLLVYGPMSLLALGLATLGLDRGSALWLGFVLVGTLPTDVSSPLLVWIARGNVALASVANAVNTALAPVLVPALFLVLTGVELDVPVAALSAELALTVLVPTIAGVALRTRFPSRLQRVEPALSATGSVAYLLLVLAVVGPNAERIVGAPRVVALLGVLALSLNVLGYLVAVAARPLLAAPQDRTAMLFTVSKKEFSIAAVVVASAGLPAEVAVPAVVYAVVQMLTSPVVARALARRGQRHG
jgi:BASS family bile acid:Na+ symporter